MALELVIVAPALPNDIERAAVAAAYEALEGDDPEDCARCWAFWEQHLTGGRPLSSEEQDLSISWECAISAVENTLSTHGIFKDATLALRQRAADPNQAGLL